MPFDPSTFTYGCELELSDVDRRMVLPKHLGRWDRSERDIVNLRPPIRGIAADPLGENPPFGGEVNTVPTRGWRGQLGIIEELLRFLGPNAGACPTSHFHVHVHVPGLENDLEALKDLATYIWLSQIDMVELCGQFEKRGDMDGAAARYMKLDGGRLMPQYMWLNMMEAETVEQFMKMHCAGRDGVSMGRPLRYAINMYSLRNTRTVEFRMFRNTLDIALIWNIFRACEGFMDRALNHGGGFRELVMAEELEFPEMQWSKELWDGLQRTKHPENRGEKTRLYREVPIGGD